jgi:glycosyltransferase involved in cell wall biosynthesis
MKLLILTQKVDKEDPILGFFHSWVEEFAKNFEKVSVVCLRAGNYNLPKNVSIYPLSVGEKNRLLKVFSFYSHIFRLRNEYDTVFVHMNPEYIVLGGLFWRILRKNIALWYTHKSVTQTLTIAEKFTHEIFTASPESFRLSSKKVHVVGHAIDTSFFKNTNLKKNNAFKIVTVGRISPSKDLGTIIRAYGRAHKKIPEMELYIVGGKGTESDSLYIESLKEFARKENFKKIYFLGEKNQKEVRGILEDASIFIHASKTGSLDKAPLEAMAMGVPVLSGSEAFTNILWNFKEILAFKKDDEDDLAHKMTVFYGLSKEEREEISKFSREFVLLYHSLPDTLSKVKNILEVRFSKKKAPFYKVILGALFSIWMKFAHIVGTVNSVIIFSILFAIVFGPYALIQKLIGVFSRNEKNETYWIEKKELLKAEEGIKRQF